MLAHRAAEVVSGGQAVIVDAVYARSADREEIARAAAAANVSFVGLWLEAPESVLIGRSGQRRQDASDADAAVIRGQIARGTDVLTWHRIDASRRADEVLQAAGNLLRDRLRAPASKPQQASS
jgi:predicted kinase